MNDYVAIVNRPQPYPIYAKSHCHYSSWKIIGRHQHNNALEFFILSKGNGIFFCGTQSRHLNPGDYVLCNSNEYHHFEVESDYAEFTIAKFRLDLLHFLSPAGFMAESIRKISYNQILFQSFLKDEVILEDLQEISSICQANDTQPTTILSEENANYTLEENNSQIKLLSLAFDILFRLLEFHVEQHFNEKNSLHFENNWRKLYKLREYLENNYSHRITLDEAGEYIGMSKGYLCRKFKEATGKNFVDYLNLLRIEKSLPLLSDNTLSITDIALSTGFEDVNYYCRVFKKYMHQSPSEFRKDHGK